jgi:hypothetical protein
VPHEDGAVVAVPSLADVPAVLARNRKLLGRATGDLLGRPLQEVRAAARVQTVAAARAYLSAAGEPVPSFDADSLLLSGHQPELFHPGVWVKNFALHRMALANGATPLNLVVDNDTAKSTLLRVPTDSHGKGHGFRIESIPFDRWGEEAPYEERPVRDEALLASLPERVQAAAADRSFEPMLPVYWREVLGQARRTNLLGERFAAARRTFERAWGCHNLELPVSLLSQTESFAWFACHLLRNLPRFHRLHNEAVHRYRQRYGIRSRSHPVPDLAAEGDLLEAPFWAWRAGQRRRGRLMVRVHRSGEHLQLMLQDLSAWTTLSLGDEGTDFRRLVREFNNLHRSGFKIRPRALTNTLFARVFLADLFVHGIGGGKYDELTDELIRTFYGIEPPRFMVLSATLLLPFAENRRPLEDCRGLHQGLRDLHWSPQRYLSPLRGPEVATLIAEKRDWIARQPPTRRGRRERFRRLQQLNAELRPHVADLEEEMRGELEECRRRHESAAVLRRRDYAFCLYPEAQLRAFCTRFLQA